MTDQEIIACLARAGALDGTNEIHCPCGVVRSMTAAFHRRTQVHDCVHHPRRQCGFCRDFDKGMALIEQRLLVEVSHGPFLCE